MSSKIGSTGDYLPFSGLTVVADVYQSNKEVFDQLYARLSSSCIPEYCSLLPKESYHITTFSIISRKKMEKDKWVKYMKCEAKRMQHLHAALNKLPDTYQFKFAVDHRKHLTLSAHLDCETVEAQRSIAEKYSLLKCIPKRFHITLGYLYKAFPNAEEENRFNEARSQIAVDFLRYELECLVAQQPKLCYYNDMTKFFPWDGTHDPFNLSEGEKEKDSEATTEAAEELSTKENATKSEAGHKREYSDV
jgi:hypothetical protein